MPVSNTLSSVVPLIFAQGLKALRHNAVMPRLVMNDFGTDVKQKGDTVQIPLPSAIAIQDVAPGAYAPDSGNVAPTTAAIALSNWKEAPFTLSDKEVAQIIAGVVPIQLSAAVEALAAQVNSDLLALHAKVPNLVGVPGTTPFSMASGVTGDAYSTNAATAARKALTVNLAPMSERRFVLGPDAEANALGLPAFQYYLYAGTDQTIRRGEIGEKFGFDWHTDQQVPTHTAGTITTGLAAKAATPQAVGLTSIVCTTAASTGACALKTGDVIAIAGQTQQYTLTADATQASAATDVTLKIYPALAVALAGGEAVTVSASHVCNLAFHKTAFAFASRPLMNDALAAEFDDSYMVPDPVSGITMRLTWRREFHRTRMSFDILYGVGAVRPMLAVRVAG